MIDTDDLDRTLRAAFNHATEPDLATIDPAPRVARRVIRRRHRRVAARVGAAVLVAGIAAATIGGLAASSNQPAHIGPPPTAPTPSALRQPQTAADRAGIAIAQNLDSTIDPSSVRLLTTNAGVRLFGARDAAGIPCAILVVPQHGGPSSNSDCSSERLTLKERQAAIERFEHQGAALGETGPGTNAIAYFVPDDITRVAVGHDRWPVANNGVLIVANHTLAFGTREKRIGFTLYVTE